MGIQTLHSSQSSNIFGKAEQRFYELTNTLQARHTLAMKFSDIEKLIENDGRELLRLLLQAHIDSRGVGDVGQSVDAVCILKAATGGILINFKVEKFII